MTGADVRASRGGASFFQNRDCPFFMCHEGVEPDDFNCLFCYCPLYALGSGCGGAFRYTEGGVKDCKRCTRLHEGTQGVAVVRERFPELAELARRDVHGQATR